MSTFFIHFLAAYLIGSISPGYFLGRIVKGVDIRRFGNRNTGATNTYRVVGPGWGITAGTFDFTKAAFVYLISLNLNYSPELAIIFGLTAILGHVFPFYINFKGGHGVASLSGLILIVILKTQTWFSLIFIAISLIYIASISKRLSAHWSWRRILKLSAFILPFGFIGISSPVFLYIVIALFVLSIGFDILRLSNVRVNSWYLANKKIAKPKEIKRLSGYSLFLLSALALFLFFPKEIVLIALNFFIVSDLIGPIAGELFLKKEITHNKTWGGAIGIFTACLIAGLFMKTLPPFEVGWEMILVGAVTVVILDQLSFILDDNLLVPLGTALALSIII